MSHRDQLQDEEDGVDGHGKILRLRDRAGVELDVAQRARQELQGCIAHRRIAGVKDGQLAQGPLADVDRLQAGLAGHGLCCQSTGECQECLASDRVKHLEKISSAERAHIGQIVIF